MKKLSIVLAMFLLLSTLAACQTTTPKTSTEPTETTETTNATSEVVSVPTPDPNTRYEISYLGPWMTDMEDDSYVEKLIENALNIELKPVKTLNGGEGVSVLVASGSLPDCMWLNDPGPNDFYYKQELVRKIPRTMAEKYAPDFVKYYDKYPILWAQALLKNSKDELITLPGLTESFTDKLYTSANFYRYDWIKATGVDLGVNVEKATDNIYIAEKGITPAKYREMLDAFVNKDPDGNSKKDTIGAVGINLPIELMGFGITKSDVMVNGQDEMYYVTEEYKQFLKFYQGLYKDGLLDKEILTQKVDAAREKINKSIGGAWNSVTIALNGWAAGRPPLRLIKEKPDVELLMVPGLADENGDFGYSLAQTPKNGWFYVNAKVKDDGKLAKILQFVNYCCFGENIPSIMYGEEGVDWNMVDNKPVVKNPLTQGVKGTWSFGTEFAQVGKMWDWITLQPTFMAGAKYYVSDFGGLWNKHIKTPERFDPLNKTDIINVRNEVQTKIDDVVNTFYSNSIMGLNDIDASWDKYIADLKTAGYDKLMTEIRKMPTYQETIEKFK